MTAARTPLPTRRQNEVRSVEHDGRAFTVCIGFDDEGKPRECFADGFREGSGMQAFVSDACVVISIALQHGIAPEALARSLGTVPTWQGEAHASPVGVILGAIGEAGR